jgi:anti-sigma regulatory factor (Ser/Thr protein kinase)
MNSFHFTFPATEMSMRVADDIFGIMINSLAIDQTEKRGLKVMVSELFIDAYLHGKNTVPETYIEVVFEIGDSELAIIVKDRRNDVSRDKIKALSYAKVDSAPKRGPGIGIMNGICDKVHSFRNAEGSFCVRVSKQIKPINNIVQAGITP